MARSRSHLEVFDRQYHTDIIEADEDAIHEDDVLSGSGTENDTESESETDDESDVDGLIASDDDSNAANGNEDYQSGTGSDESSDDESADDESADDESADDQSSDDESADDESADDQSSD